MSRDSTSRDSNQPPLWPWLAAAAALMLGGFLGWRALHSQPEEETVDETPTAAAEAPKPEPEDVPVPPRAQTDQSLKQLLAGLSALPQWRAFLKPEDLLNRIVGAVDNLAEGKTPREPLDFLAPQGPFAVDERGSRLLLSQRAAERYDGFAAAIASIDAAAAAKAYGTLLPLFRSAYHRFGYPGRDFDLVAKRAVDNILAVPRIGDVALVSEQGAAYRFASRSQEEASDLAKQLWRMGPANQQKVQAKAAELRRTLWP